MKKLLTLLGVGLTLLAQPAWSGTLPSTIASSFSSTYSSTLGVKGRRLQFVVLPATYINSGIFQFTAAGNTWSIPTGAATGDLLVIEGQDALTSGLVITVTGSGATMTAVQTDTTSLGYLQTVFYKTLTAADISTGTASDGGTGDASGGVLMSIYRGPSLVVVKSFVESSSGASTLVFTGFTPSALSKGVVAFAFDRDPTGTITAASGFTNRISAGALTFFRGLASDYLSGYTNASATFSTFTAVQPQAGHILELD